MTEMMAEAMRITANDGCDPYNSLPEIMFNYEMLRKVDEFEKTQEL